MEVNARVWKVPTAMAVTVVPVGSLTATGVVLSVLVPSPNSPPVLLPQARTAPVEVNAKLLASLPAMAVIVVPAGRSTSTGVLLSMVVPSPSWPKSFSPQVRTVSDATPDGDGACCAAAGHTATACVTTAANTTKNQPVTARLPRPAPRPARRQSLSIVPTSEQASTANRTDASVNRLSRIDAEKRPQADIQLTPPVVAAACLVAEEHHPGSRPLGWWFFVRDGEGHRDRDEPAPRP